MPCWRGPPFTQSNSQGLEAQEDKPAVTPMVSGGENLKPKSLVLRFGLLPVCPLWHSPHVFRTSLYPTSDILQASWAYPKV